MAIPLLGPALGVGAGLLSYKDAQKQNKRLRDLMADTQPYSGYLPPHIAENVFRPAEQLNWDIISKGAQGEGVGFDPRRRALLQETYDLEQQPRLEQGRADIINQLSGMGLSRNLGAREASLGRFQQENERNRNLYRNRIDIEDLTRANEERDINRARLAQLNQFNFGQENQRAGAEQQAWSQEQANKLNQARVNAGIEDMTKSPIGEAFSAGLSTMGAVGGGGGGGSNIMQRGLGLMGMGPYGSPINTTSGMGYRSFSPIPISGRRV